MLYRFPISIYIIFSRLWHPQTLAALVHLRSFGEKQPGLSTGTFNVSATQTIKENRNYKKKQNPQTFLLRLETYT